MISVTINASVGANGKNIAKDVKTVIALLNVYLRSLKKTPVPMSGTEWGTLHAAIKDIAIDLKFRGDYTSASRKKIQKSIADNDMVEFKKQIKNQTNWPDVPSDRFNRRVKFIDKY
jgi:hypothetical protein